jgi:EAL domain-containing protein (putative c-di-GMP-specific phosphodiesterase class I)
MKNIAKLIENNDLYHVFQPLRRLPCQSIIGYEALLRSTSGIDPSALFQLAVEQDRLYQLDIWSMEHALVSFCSCAVAKETGGLLFVNLFPSTVIAESFPSFIEVLRQKFDAVIPRVVIEINESITEERVWNDPLFMDRIAELRKQKFLLALDDVGEGSTSFRKIVETSPDFIKIDRFFSKDLYRCKKKQKIVRLFVDYCKDTESDLILEGIEVEEDMVCAFHLGVPIGQGYFLGKPRLL